MRIYPPVAKGEMVAYLTSQARLIWGDTPPMSEEVLDTVAEAMTVIMALDVPDGVEPLFP